MLRDGRVRPGRGPGVAHRPGKGGVGTTTVAAALARALASAGLVVHLSTTDPAAHVEAAVGADRPAGPTVSRIDPAAETARYAEEVLGDAEAAAAPVGGLDADERALLLLDAAESYHREVARLSASAPGANIPEAVRALLLRLLAARATLEAPHLARVRTSLAARAWLIPRRA